MASKSDKLSAQSHLALDERIRARAREICKGRCGNEEYSTEDWLAAEREVVGGSGEETQSRGTVVGSAGRPDREQMSEITDDE